MKKQVLALITAVAGLVGYAEARIAAVIEHIETLKPALEKIDRALDTLDALQGDASLFLRRDGIERSWEIMDPIIQSWDSDDAPPLEIYERASWGPGASRKLLAADDREWQRGCGIH